MVIHYVLVLFGIRGGRKLNIIPLKLAVERLFSEFISDRDFEIKVILYVEFFEFRDKVKSIFSNFGSILLETQFYDVNY